MIASIILFHIPFVVLPIYAVFFYKTNYVAPWPPNKRINWKPKKSDIVIDRFVRVVIIIALYFFFFTDVSYFALDVYDFAINHSVVTGKYLVKYKEGPSSWRVPYYYMDLKLMGFDEQKFTIFFYSPKYIQKGQRYYFDLLPRSGVILRAQRAIN